MKYFILSAFLLLSLNAFCQSGLNGKVSNESMEPLPGVTIYLEELQVGTTTDFEGFYNLKDIPEGTWTVTVRMLGYQTTKEKVAFTTNSIETYNTLLKEDYGSLDEVVISASRNPEYLSEIPASVSVVNSEKLTEFTKLSSNINEILAFAVPGLAVGTGTFSNWGQTLRGRSLLVMVDGIPQSTPLRNGLLGIRSINPNDISRVEVIKGATSIFGNGGNGGFINYITKNPTSTEKISGTTNIWGTSQLSNTEDALGYGIYQSITGKKDKFNYYISGSIEHTGNKYDAEGVPLLPTYGLDNTNIYSTYGKLEYLLSENQKITLNGNFYKSLQDSPFIPVFANVQVLNEKGDYSLEPGYGIKGSIPEEQPTGSQLINGRLKYNLNAIFSGTTDFETDIYYSKAKSIFFYSDKFENGGQSVINSEKYGVRPNFSTRINTYRNIDLSFIYGLDLLMDKTNQGLLDGRLWVPNIELMGVAPYLQTTLKLDKKWAFKVGLRYDDLKMNIADYNTLPYSPKGDGNFNPSIAVQGGKLAFDNLAFNMGVRYIEHQEFIPYISYSQGFSIADLGSILRSAIAENIDNILLEPAVTNNYEFGFISKFKNLRLEAVGYYSTSNLGTGVVFSDELNSFVPSELPQKIFGGEFVIDYAFSNNKLLLGASYSYVEGLKNPKGDENNLSYVGGDVISAPKLTAYATWSPTEKISTTLNVINLSDRKRFDPFQDAKGNYAFRHTEFPVNGYTLVNLSATYKIKSNIDVSLGINNLLNEYYLPARSQWAAPLRSFTVVGEGANARLSLAYNF
ncbi:TonB-dependent receptor [Algoriphagus aquimarinus]|uniref:Iron complex outermembrane recepter protein n=1 Tax=Algoriphagus aquimarinus TaxID=237018 RepID=A0A1I1BK79_9BACT|nr:TonB-dependent receptor [Algoriphagus aquimarinus]SFB50172.1 iron complex outermembrane recepter protein [Algoriphagus aquimarinus]